MEASCRRMSLAVVPEWTVPVLPLQALAWWSIPSGKAREGGGLSSIRTMRMTVPGRTVPAGVSMEVFMVLYCWSASSRQ